jgi:transposase InsO family protein
MLKRHGLNILKCQFKRRKYNRFEIKNPNDMVQMDIIGSYYLSNSGTRNYFISCLDDYFRKVASRLWSERKRSIDVLGVLEDWIMNNGKPKTVIHDNGKQTSKRFKHFLVHNNIRDKRIPNFYPQMQGKIEEYNKIVRNEFLANVILYKTSFIRLEL